MDALQALRSFGGLQAYPSHRKNPEIVDISTGSMGLGAVQATFGALATRYLADHGQAAKPERVIVMVGDAELDEGNVWEALAEEAVARLGNVLWIVDVNRQSLDRIVPDARRRQLPELFRTFGWNAIELRYGSKLAALFERPGRQAAARAAGRHALRGVPEPPAPARGRGAQGAGDRRGRRDRPRARSPARVGRRRCAARARSAISAGTTSR